MTFKNLFKLIKRSKASDKKSAAANAEEYADSLNIEAVQVVADASKHAPLEADVHVKMVFNDAGEIVACQVEHLNALSPEGVSGTSTLVERSPALPISRPSASKCISVEDVKLAAASRLLAPPSSRPAFTTADFRVFQVLGAGAQGTVSLVQHKKNGRFYALKAMCKREHKVDHYPFVFQEQAILKKLAGSHWSTQLRGSFEDNENFYLLTDFYPEGDFAKRIFKRGKIVGPDAKGYCAQLILALEDLHRRRVIHRDIKPANILVTRDNELVLSDFGFSRPFDLTSAEQPWCLRDVWSNEASAEILPLDMSTMTLGDVTQRDCGTAGYMAPEVARGEQYSYTADIFSLGVVFYEMLNGKLPFGIDRTNRIPQLVYDLMMSQAVEVSEDVDVGAHDLLYMMLEKDASRRPTLEQIKAHPWFSSINWKELSRRLPPRPLRPSPGFQPDEDIPQVSFGASYVAGEAPHWWYNWTEPDFPTENTPEHPEKKTKTTRKTVSAIDKSQANILRAVPSALSAVFASPVPLPPPSPSPGLLAPIAHVPAGSRTLSVSQVVPRASPATPSSPTLVSHTISPSSIPSTLGGDIDNSDQSYARSVSAWSSIALSAGSSSSFSSSLVASGPACDSPSGVPCCVPPPPARQPESTTRSSKSKLLSFFRRAWRALCGVRTVSQRKDGRRLDLVD